MPEGQKPITLSDGYAEVEKDGPGEIERGLFSGGEEVDLGMQEKLDEQDPLDKENLDNSVMNERVQKLVESAQEETDQELSRQDEPQTPIPSGAKAPDTESETDLSVLKNWPKRAEISSTPVGKVLPPTKKRPRGTRYSKEPNL